MSTEIPDFNIKLTDEEKLKIIADLMKVDESDFHPIKDNPLNKKEEKDEKVEGTTKP